MQINVLEMLPPLVALQIFQILYLSCGESLNHNTKSHYYEAHIEHISENIIYITKKTPKLVAKIWLPNLVLYQTTYGGPALRYVYTRQDIGCDQWCRCNDTWNGSYIEILNNIVYTKWDLDTSKDYVLWQLDPIASEVQ